MSSRTGRLLALLFVCSMAVAANGDTPPPLVPPIRLTLTAEPNVVHPGDQLTYTVKLTNPSAYDAQGVALTWTLPGTVVATTCGTTVDQFCFFGMYAGSTLTMTRTIRVDAVAGTELVASAKLSSPSRPVDPPATLSMTVTEAPQADVAVTVGAGSATLQTGDAVTYTLTATNAGAGAATDVTVQFSLPSGLAFLSASPGCTAAPSAVVCSAGTLESGSSTAFAVTARAVEAGSITTTASVSTTSPEANGGNNSGSATIVVTPARRHAARH